MITGIIGLGLMGGSLAKIAKKNGNVVYGLDVVTETVSKAIEIGAIDGELTEERAKELDLLVVAVFPDYFENAVGKFLPLLKRGAVVCDFCGIKRAIVGKMEEFAQKYSDLYFVGGHPMAGREVSGLDNSLESLFERASMILVNVNADRKTLDSLKEFYLSCGFGSVVETDAENHDAMIAFTSQLCHIVSNAFIKNSTAKRHFGYSAGSYKDMTRVARLDPEMWTQLMNANRDKLSVELDELIENLSKYRDALKSGDKERLKELLVEGNEMKLSIDKRSD